MSRTEKQKIADLNAHMLSVSRYGSGDVGIPDGKKLGSMQQELEGNVQVVAREEGTRVAQKRVREGVTGGNFSQS